MTKLVTKVQQNKNLLFIFNIQKSSNTSSNQR